MANTDIDQGSTANADIRETLDYKIRLLRHNQIMIIPFVNAADRSEMHQFLEKEFPYMPKTSLYIATFDADVKHRYVLCWNCDYRRVNIDEYHHGYEGSNIDEYRSGVCPKCDELVIFECNYDNRDNLIYVYYNNVIAIGDYFKGYANRKKFKKLSGTVNDRVYIPDPEVCYIIPRPEKLLTKRELGGYIRLKISLLKK